MSPAPVRWSEVTALFGGTFDPPHQGHRTAIGGLFQLPGVRAVRVIPSPNPPHKSTQAQAHDRVEMAKLAFAHSSSFPHRDVQIDLCEIHRAAENPGHPTYSFDTLSELRRQIPQLAFVLGTDQLEKLPTWHRFPEILGLCHWIVLARKGSLQQGAQKVLGQLVASGLIQPEGAAWRVRTSGHLIQVFETQAPDLSSTRIRETLARSGFPPDGAIPPEVHAYLMKHHLYGMRQQ